jgi:FtsP/CotA-like multicopper oxidase with cupredoxin domain
MSMMTHPMHLYGHFFQLENGTERGPLKNTVLINPMQNITTNWVSDNPGTWAYHCHNAYHQMAGMMRFVKVSEMALSGIVETRIWESRQYWFHISRCKEGVRLL